MRSQFHDHPATLLTERSRRLNIGNVNTHLSLRQ